MVDERFHSSQSRPCGRLGIVSPHRLPHRVLRRSAEYLLQRGMGRSHLRRQTERQPRPVIERRERPGCDHPVAGHHGHKFCVVHAGVEEDEVSVRDRILPAELVQQPAEGGAGRRDLGAAGLDVALVLQRGDGNVC